MGADGFEPPKGDSPPDLQSGAIGRSATPPFSWGQTTKIRSESIIAKDDKLLRDLLIIY